MGCFRQTGGVGVDPRLGLFSSVVALTMVAQIPSGPTLHRRTQSRSPCRLVRRPISVAEFSVPVQPDDREVHDNALHLPDISGAFSWFSPMITFPPLIGAKPLAPRIYLRSVRLSNSLVPAELVRDPAPAPFGSMLDPVPMPVLPINASAVC